MPGTLFVVATPIGNLEDITLRALRILRSVAVIAAEDTRHTAHLLARHAISTPTTSLHEHNEVKKAPALVARLLSGDDLALVSDAGTPTVSDPGGKLIRAAIAAGIRVEAIPGPSAAIAALAASGLPTETFAFLGFPPTKRKDREAWLDRMRSVGGTVVFFEAPHRIRRTLEDALRVVGDRPVMVARELTKTHEDLVRGQISDVLAGPLREQGEFTVVVNIGQSIDNVRQRPPSAAALLVEFGELTENKGLPRRRAIAEVARRHGMPPNVVYDAIEDAKKSGH